MKGLVRSALGVYHVHDPRDLRRLLCGGSIHIGSESYRANSAVNVEVCAVCLAKAAEWAHLTCSMFRAFRSDAGRWT